MPGEIETCAASVTYQLSVVDEPGWILAGDAVNATMVGAGVVTATATVRVTPPARLVAVSV